MTQPSPCRHHIAELLEPTLGSIITALSDRDLPEEEWPARAAGVRTVIESFQPRTSTDLLLVGQLLGINEAFAEATRELLCGVEDKEKPGTRSTIVTMARLTQGHIRLLRARGSRAVHAEIAAPRPERSLAPLTEAEPPPAEPPDQPKVAAPNTASNPTPQPEAAVATTPEPDPTAPAVSDEERSWVDEPYQEWLIETPAMLAAQSKPEPPPAAPSRPKSSGEGLVPPRQTPDTRLPFPESVAHGAQNFADAASGD